MTSFRVRPRFRQELDVPPAKLMGMIKGYVINHSDLCDGTFVSNHITLKIPQAQQHFWSPQLDVSLEENEGGTIIRGLYGPKPSVWTLFMFGYSVVGILMLFLSLTTFSKWSLGMPVPEIWAIPVLAMLGLGLYFISQVGQKLGAEQTFQLHHIFEEALHQRFHIR